MNTFDGLLINENLKSPKAALADPADNSPTRPSDPTPDLARRSDLTWLNVGAPVRRDGQAAGWPALFS